MNEKTEENAQRYIATARRLLRRCCHGDARVMLMRLFVKYSYDVVMLLRFIMPNFRQSIRP